MNNSLVLFCASLLLFCSAALAQPDLNAPGVGPIRPAPVPQGVFFPDTPANAARTFFNAIQSQDEAAISLVVQGAPVEKFGPNEWGTAMREKIPSSTIQKWQIDSIITETQSQSDATVSLAFHIEWKDDNPRELREPIRVTIPLRLHRDPGNKTLMGSGGKDVWRIVPPSTQIILDQGFSRADLFDLVAVLALHEPRLLPAIRYQKDLAGLKQLAMGTTQFVFDHDENYAFDDIGYAEAIKGYLHTDNLFSIRGTSGGKWHFNNNLSKKDLAAVTEPTRTVLIYDGTAPEPDKLNFRFDNRTLIAFADGHVMALTKAQANDLIWKP